MEGNQESYNHEEHHEEEHEHNGHHEHHDHHAEASHHHHHVEQGHHHQNIHVESNHGAAVQGKYTSGNYLANLSENDRNLIIKYKKLHSQQNNQMIQQQGQLLQGGAQHYQGGAQHFQGGAQHIHGGGQHIQGGAHHYQGGPQQAQFYQGGAQFGQQLQGGFQQNQNFQAQAQAQAFPQKSNVFQNFKSGIFQQGQQQFPQRQCQPMQCPPPQGQLQGYRSIAQGPCANYGQNFSALRSAQCHPKESMFIGRPGMPAGFGPRPSPTQFNYGGFGGQANFGAPCIPPQLTSPRRGIQGFNPIQSRVQNFGGFGIQPQVGGAIIGGASQFVNQGVPLQAGRIGGLNNIAALTSPSNQRLGNANAVNATPSKPNWGDFKNATATDSICLTKYKK